MRLVTLIAVPAAAGLIVLAGPLVATIFFGGEFTDQDVHLTALALQAFAITLLAILTSDDPLHPIFTLQLGTYVFRSHLNHLLTSDRT